MQSTHIRQNAMIRSLAAAAEVEAAEEAAEVEAEAAEVAAGIAFSRTDAETINKRKMRSADY